LLCWPFVAVALGGFGSILGSLVAGLLIGLVESLGGLLLDPFLQDGDRVRALSGGGDRCGPTACSQVLEKMASDRARMLEAAKKRAPCGAPLPLWAIGLGFAAAAFLLAIPFCSRRRSRII
jgi:hypothetical protein